MSKTTDDYWIDWESSAFGFGYGSGEEYVIPALRRFLELCTQRYGTPTFAYDHEELSADLTPTVAWLLINVLCRERMISYGTSPRFGWLTETGTRLRGYVLSKSADDLAYLICNPEIPTICYRDACNCGANGYQKGVRCLNPFWWEDAPMPTGSAA